MTFTSAGGVGLLLGVRWLVGWWVGGRFPLLSDAVRDGALRAGPPGGTPGPSVSVIIPARNEATTLPSLLASLQQQSGRPHQVIVVDDQSTDGTAAVAASAGAVVVSPDQPPVGWLGKPWACAHGAAFASGDVLVFLDADTTLGVDALAQLVPVVVASGGLVSAAPYHATERAYERLSALFNLVAVMGTGAATVTRGGRITGAFGPCLSLSRASYDLIGGHGAVRDEVLDDVALAERCAALGVPVQCFAGGAVVQFRMYPEGLGQLVEGWSKNFAAGAGRTQPLRLAAIVAWMSGLIEAGWWAVAGAAQAASGAMPMPVIYGIFYVAFAVQLWLLLRRLGNFAASAAVHPLLTLAFVAICLRSLLLLWRGQVTWKGRTISVTPR